MKNSYLLSEHRSAQFLLRYIGIYLTYFAVVVRTWILSFGEADFPRIAALLAVFGALLVFSNFLEGQKSELIIPYLLVQTVLILAINPQTFNQDFFPLLFLPLSLQAVLFFGRRKGFTWIGVFSILATIETLMSWQGQLSGFAEGILFTAVFVFTGNYAHLIRTAEATRQKNRRLLEDLKITYRHLQEYSTKMEAYAALEERNRMARELHDSATQTIFSMNLAVQAAQLLAVKDPGRMVEQLDRLNELAQSAERELQALSSQLIISTLAEEGLPAGLRRLVDERKLRDGLEIRLEIDGERVLDEVVSSGLFRITQEALNNIAKHARTRQVDIHLHLDRAPACLEIADQGAGFDPELARHLNGHIGLHGMAERADEINWKLTLDSHPGQGTYIRVEEVSG